MKNLIKISLVAVILAALSIPAIAQVDEPPAQRPWVKEHTENSTAVPFDHLREADVMYGRTIWRVIDLREKINHPLYFPEMPTRDKVSLTQLLWNMCAIEGSLTVFRSDEFLEIYPPEEILSGAVKTDTQYVWNEQLFAYDTIPIKEEFASADVLKYRIREDWFFDKQRSVWECRIMGIAPVLQKFIVDPQTGERVEKGTQPLFWVYMPWARTQLSKYETYNRFNDAERLSFDAIFTNRFFGSYIIREENVYDRYISMYKTGLDALLEAEKIENDLIEFEIDLWEF